jgi:hypothetical protein
MTEHMLYNGNRLERMPVEKHKYARCNTMNFHCLAFIPHIRNIYANICEPRWSACVFCARFKIRSQRNARSKLARVFAAIRFR